MSWIDIAIFCSYLFVMLGVGFYFMKKNSSTDDYYVGGRKLSSVHIGLSVVATDVGGGFSIGLGGLGFIMGLSGSWLLFTGLVGAWLSGVLLIPKVYDLARRKGFLSFPQFLEHTFNKRVAIVAGIISAIGYTGFTSSQLLAGAKLASSTFAALSVNQALLIMGVVAIVYTVLGGLKAVIYTDTVQWIVLMTGLIFVGLPFAYINIGGYETIKTTLAPSFFSLTSISWQQMVNWMFTIIPIWFIGMTLYQRIYAAKSAKTAKRGWFIAGLFEYPVMAFVGVILGMFARVAVENGQLPGFSMANIDAEMGLPLLLKNVLPIGFLGIVLSAYFSAIMSTADSCLMAASGNMLIDVFKKRGLRQSQLLTFVIGVLALIIALKMTNVLELMLHSYAFMVSGMFIPVLVALFARTPNSKAAFASMVAGGVTTLTLLVSNARLPLELDANIFGIMASLIVYMLVSFVYKAPTKNAVL
ncbi:solute:Na+ symporter, SSS family [Mariniphaga anaerophila]|uniref:Solute:Na+ symporter, SSS family n=1 Tax=Mariniphaga anaerophila TaxID=1484053 RepID=A0A1M4ZPI2_9BACT|nr:sodium:solute symporter family protein [Mariniphaga anaerophila]SHF19959.1 solute:Na+ symporter, SSS family [Mariniphaga anaerophila]